VSPVALSSKDYWLLYVDVQGISAAMGLKSRRDRVVEAYECIAADLRGGGVVADAAAAQEAFKSGSAQAAAQAREDVREDWSRRLRIFSDSIFVFFDAAARTLHAPGDGANPLMLPEVAAGLSQTLWMFRLPHRGAIAYGECFFDPFGDVCLGSPIVEAVKWEHRQEWLGISVVPDPRVLVRVKGVFGDGAGCLTEATVPAAEGTAVATICVNPLSPSAGTLTPADAVLKAFLQARDEARTDGYAKMARYDATGQLFDEFAAA
jgi:hypothetical protein